MDLPRRSPGMCAGVRVDPGAAGRGIGRGTVWYRCLCCQALCRPSPPRGRHWEHGARLTTVPASTRAAFFGAMAPIISITTHTQHQTTFKKETCLHRPARHRWPHRWPLSTAPQLQGDILLAPVAPQQAEDSGSGSRLLSQASAAAFVSAGRGGAAGESALFNVQEHTALEAVSGSWSAAAERQGPRWASCASG